MEILFITFTRIGGDAVAEHAPSLTKNLICKHVNLIGSNRVWVKKIPPICTKPCRQKRNQSAHDGVMTWKQYLRRCCSFVRGIHQSQVDIYLASNVEHWWFYDISSNKLLNKQSSGWWLRRMTLIRHNCGANHVYIYWNLFLIITPYLVAKRSAWYSIYP